MTQKTSQWRFWLIVLTVVIGLGYLLHAMLVPFLAGLIIAYFLSPIVEILADQKIPFTKKTYWPRWICTVVVLSSFIFFIILLALLLLPMLQAQISALIAATPVYVEKFRSTYIPSIENWAAQFSPDDVQKMRDTAGNSVSGIVGWLAGFTSNIVKSGFAMFDVLTLLILTPVVAFYMLVDWEKITSTFDSLIPQKHYNVIHAQMKEIDKTLSGFLRGQAIVCTILGFYYALGLTVVDLQYGTAIGVLAGVLTFIPYVGASFGWITSLFLAMAQFDGDWSRILPVIGVFFIGQLVETYVLTPHFVGNRVNLHPVWILFALLAGAHTMGFAGVLLAVPAAAVIGVLIRFGTKQYRASSLYKESL